jgi:hypothetical protein
LVAALDDPGVSDSLIGNQNAYRAVFRMCQEFDHFASIDLRVFQDLATVFTGPPVLLPWPSFLELRTL